MAVEKVDGQAPLESFGFDSITVTRLNRRIRETFGDISTTLFYEYRTLAEVADFLASSGAVIQAGLPRVVEPDSNAAWRTNSGTMTEPIAIIGISGRYPGSRDLEAFWHHLQAGNDLVTEIPNDRWPLANFYLANVEEAIAQGKSYAKWGSFLDNVTEFDPLFFALSPREAMEMDPQERLFLQTAWEALEDAGLTREALQRQYHRRVGIFAGVTKTGYELYGPALRDQGEQVFPHTSFSSFANRLSYFLDVEGPSMPIDTM